LSKPEVEYARDAYGPGDTIEGVIVATDRIKARDDGESALAFGWRVVARENERLRRDPQREAPIEVLP
jgi:hypothetical protein